MIYSLSDPILLKFFVGPARRTLIRKIMLARFGKKLNQLRSSESGGKHTRRDEKQYRLLLHTVMNGLLLLGVSYDQTKTILQELNIWG